MSKLTREDLIDGIFTSYRKKSDVRDESRRIIQDAIITTAEKIDDYFELECDPIEPGCFLWDVVENAINTTENVAFQAAVNLLTGKLSEMEDYINAD